MTKRRIDQKRIVKNHEPSSVERDSLACICLIDHFQIYIFFFKKAESFFTTFLPFLSSLLFAGDDFTFLSVPALCGSAFEILSTADKRQ